MPKTKETYRIVQVTPNPLWKCCPPDISSQAGILYALIPRVLAFQIFSNVSFWNFAFRNTLPNSFFHPCTALDRGGGSFEIPSFCQNCLNIICLETVQKCAAHKWSGWYLIVLMRFNEPFQNLGLLNFFGKRVGWGYNPNFFSRARLTVPPTNSCLMFFCKIILGLNLQPNTRQSGMKSNGVKFIAFPLINRKIVL